MEINERFHITDCLTNIQSLSKPNAQCTCMMHGFKLYLIDDFGTENGWSGRSTTLHLAHQGFNDGPARTSWCTHVRLQQQNTMATPGFPPPMAAMLIDRQWCGSRSLAVPEEPKITSLGRIIHGNNQIIHSDARHVCCLRSDRFGVSRM